MVKALFGIHFNLQILKKKSYPGVYLINVYLKQQYVLI